MLHTLGRTGRRFCAAPIASRPCSLQLLALEDRLTPALTIQVSYEYDLNGLFADPAHRASLERAADELESRIDSTLAPIAAGGVNQWRAIAVHPSTGGQLDLPNLNVPADTIIIFAGSMSLPGTEAGLGGPGGYWASGSRAFQANVATRGVSGFSSWGGTVSFDTGTNWYYGEDPNGRALGQIDFQSVAVHELIHALGFGTSNQFSALVQSGRLVGSNTNAVGGTVFVSPDQAHFAQGTKSGGQSVSMQPILDISGRIHPTELDYAVLKDIGWIVNAAPRVELPSTPVVPTVPVVPQPTVPQAPVPIVTVVPPNSSAQTAAPSAATTLVVSGANDGTVQIYTVTGGAFTLSATPFRPFSNFNGAVRSAVGDVNGDRIADIVLGTGPGGGSRIRVLDGRTYADLIPEFWAFEVGFNGGVFLASGDLNQDGKDDIIISPDQGGGPRVRVLALDSGRLNTVADFFGLDDSSFRGGARVSVGDINGDGADDLVVAAGFGGGPRVSVLDGKAVARNVRQQLTADFFAFEPSLRNGVYLTVADINADGMDDLVFGAGPGGGPRIITLSGKTLLQQGSLAALSDKLGNAFVGDVNQRGGVRVVAKDFDGDGQVEIVTGSGQGGQLTSLDGRSLFTETSLTPFNTTNLDGIYVG